MYCSEAMTMTCMTLCGGISAYIYGSFLFEWNCPDFPLNLMFHCINLFEQYFPKVLGNFKTSYFPRLEHSIIKAEIDIAFYR